MSSQIVSARILRILSVAMLVIALTAAIPKFIAAHAYAPDKGEPVPPFSARTLDNEYFSNNTIKGKIVLLQFWTTWCPYCRKEQPIVDGLTREFADQDLIVLAVNVGESKSKVKNYLEHSPRECRIVLHEDTNLTKSFPTRGFPLYVLIDREGNVAGVQNGAGGEESLRSLLKHAGLGVYTVQKEKIWKNCQSNDADTAISGCSAALQMDTADAEDRRIAYFNRGLAYHDKKMFDEAIADYSRVIQLDAKDAAAYRERGVEWSKKELPDKAIADYSKAIELNPNDAAAYRYRGLEYEMIRERDKAIADYRRSLVVAPNSKFAQDGLKRLGAQ